MGKGIRKEEAEHVCLWFTSTLVINGQKKIYVHLGHTVAECVGTKQSCPVLPRHLVTLRIQSFIWMCKVGTTHMDHLDRIGKGKER